MLVAYKWTDCVSHLIQVTESHMCMLTAYRLVLMLLCIRTSLFFVLNYTLILPCTAVVLILA